MTDTPRTRIRRAAASLLLVLVLTPAPLTGQTTTGDIQGVVHTQSGEPLDAVAVSVTNVETGAVRRTRTSAGGRFSVTGLPPGTYEVLAVLEGFASQRQERVALGIAQTIVSRLELRPAPMPDTLTLAAPPSVLEPRHADISARIERVELDLLPLARRRPLDLVALTPGVTAAPAADAPAFGGVAGEHNSLNVDGTDLWPLSSGPSPAGGLSPAYRFGRSSLRNLHVIASAPPASFDGAGGTIVNVVTRSGGERFTGEVFQAFRDAALSANTQANADRGLPRPDLHTDQFGGSAGGPLAPGHVLFASYEGLRERHVNAVHPGGTSPALVAPFARDWTRTRNQHLLFVRSDHRVAGAGRLSLRYHQLDLDGVGLDARGPFRTRSSTGPGELGSRAAAATLGHTPWGSLTNELRALYVHQHERLGASGDDPHAHVTDVGALVLRTGRSTLAPYESRLHRLQIADTVMWSGARHAVKAGADVELDAWTHRSSANARGTYVFRSPESFTSGTPVATGETFSQAFYAGDEGRVTVEPDTRTLALFVQDKWLVTDAVAVDAGLRAEASHVSAPATTNPDARLLALGIDTGRLAADDTVLEPRIGLAWAPSPQHVVRAGYGILHGRVPMHLVSAAQAYNGVDATAVTFSASRADPLPTYPGRFDALPSGARPDVVFFADTFERPRFEQASASYEWQWMPTTSIGASYFHVAGDRLPRFVDVNVGAPVPVLFTVAGEDEARPVFRHAAGPLPGFGRVIRYESTAESRYDGAAVELRRRGDQGWQYRITYTFGRTRDTAPPPAHVLADGTDTAGTAAAPDAAAVWAPADRDLRQQLVVSSAYSSDLLAERYDGIVENLLRNWRVGVIYKAVSGLPYSARLDADLDGDLNRWNDLAPGTTRNQFRRRAIMRLDVRISRRFLARDRIELTASADIFNALNTAHDRDVDTTLYSVQGHTLVRNPGFGEARDQLLPRTMQLGVGVRF